MSDPVLIEFLFDDPPASNGDLVFKPTGVGGTANATITGTFPALTASLLVGQYIPTTITGLFPALTANASAEYSTQTQRPTVGKTDAPHQVATKVQTGPEQPHQDTRSAPVGWSAFWEKVTNGSQTIEHRLPNVFIKSPVPQAGVFQNATREHTQTGYRHQDGTPIWKDRNAIFQNATGTRNDTFFRHQDGTKTHSVRGSQFENATLLHVAGHYGQFQAASALARLLGGRYQEGVPPPPGISLLPPGPPGPSPCYLPDSDLVFAFQPQSNLHFVFICDGDTPPPPPPPPGETIVVPVQRVYIVLNSASLRRVSDNALVPTLSMSLSLDASSWTWGFDATVPMQAQALVEPDTGPVELNATVNGVEFRVLAEKLSRERSFGRASLRISGRGKNAVLDAPYAPVTTYRNEIDRTANQLAEDALTYNGVPMPWGVDWQLTDWLVPAGVFTHQGTHISALNAIAQAAGGYLQPHRTLNTLRILPKYPSAPWQWGSVTPDFELPAAVTTRESIEWIDKPSYNRVFVSGQQVGVLGQVTRTGTAGDLVAQMVADPLITHADAARQRGISILADTGRTASVGLSLPVLASTGVIEPGKFVRYVDGGTTRLGIVRSTSVTVGETAVDTRQQIVLETHDA